jgi:hypothetical protein
MRNATLAILGLAAFAAPAFADNGPIPRRDPRQPPSIQRQAAERPAALTGSQRSSDKEWTVQKRSVGGHRTSQTIYTR